MLTTSAPSLGKSPPEKDTQSTTYPTIETNTQMTTATTKATMTFEQATKLWNCEEAQAQYAKFCYDGEFPEHHPVYEAAIVIGRERTAWSIAKDEAERAADDFIAARRSKAASQA